MIGGPHAQSIMYNLVATSRDRYYSAGLKERSGSFVAYEDLDLDLARMRRWHPLNRSLYLGYKVQLAGLLLSQKGDRVAMANSVEARYPFLDEDVIAFASRLHPRWKLRGLAATNICCARRRSGCCPRRWHSGRRPCSARRSPRRFSPSPPSFVRDLISPEFACAHRLFRCERRRAATARRWTSGDGKLGTFASLGLGGVVATQLWHHLYLGGGLCELPHIEHQRVAEPPAETSTLAVA